MSALKVKVKATQGTPSVQGVAANLRVMRPVSASLFIIIAAALLCCDAAQMTAALALRGGAGRRKHKAVHLHDLARNDSRNEYFAGGQDEEGRGSATVLIYPDEPDADSNSTEAEDAAAEPVEKPSAFKGQGRKL